jgi:AcrR family transcriptional regulator
MPTPRQRAREQTLADITRLGRDQLAAVGAAQLSVRSLARDLGVVSSAVYRYVASRDELLTLLVVDAYDELAGAVEAAVERRRAGDHQGRLVAAGHAVRDWAVAEPARYALLYGSPVPGYQAPAERTTGPGTRVILAVVAPLVQAWRDGALAPAEGPSVPRTLARDLDAIRAVVGAEMPDDVLVRALLVWTSVFGLVSFEVFGQYGADTFSRPAQLFDAQLSTLCETVGLVSRR